MESKAEKRSGRVIAIDTLRGFDFLFIMGLHIVVLGLMEAFPCGLTQWLHVQMEHVDWDGLRIMDCVYPTFLFTAGLSFPFSYASQLARGSSQKAIHLKMLRRLFALIALGWVFNGFLHLDFSHFRWASVLGRIGVSWFFAGLVFIHFGWRTRLAVAAGFLIGYWLLIGYVPAPDMPPGTDPLSLEGNFAGYVDRLIMPGMMWEKNAAGVELMEPSGTIENIPSIVTALLGMFAGEFVRVGRQTPARKALLLAAGTAALLGLGLLLALDCPINKKIWSSSFVLVAGAISLGCFTLFYWLTDVLGWTRWSFFFQVIGANAITIYMVRAIVSFGSIGNYFLCGVIAHSGAWAHIVEGLGGIAAAWLFLWYLYRNKTFLRV